MDELCGDIMAAQNEVQVEFENTVAMRCENEVVNEIELGCEEGKDGGVVTGEVEEVYAGEMIPMGVKNDILALRPSREPDSYTQGSTIP